MDNGIYNAIWQYDNLMGFEKGKSYVIKITKKKNSSYKIIDLENDLCINCSSEKSIKRYFKNIKKND